MEAAANKVICRISRTQNLVYHLLANVASTDPAQVYNPAYCAAHPLQTSISDTLMAWLQANISPVSHIPFFEPIWKQIGDSSDFVEFHNLLEQEEVSYDARWTFVAVDQILSQFREYYLEWVQEADLFFARVTNHAMSGEKTVWLIQAMPLRRGKNSAPSGSVAVAFPPAYGTGAALTYLRVLVHEWAHHYSDVLLAQLGGVLPEGNTGALYEQREMCAEWLTSLFFRSVNVNVGIAMHEGRVPSVFRDRVWQNLICFQDGIRIVHLGQYSKEWSPALPDGQVKLVESVYFIEKDDQTVTYFLPDPGRLLIVPLHYFEQLNPLTLKSVYREHFVAAGLLVPLGYRPEWGESVEGGDPFSAMERLRFHLTEGCNLRCTYCYLRGGEQGQTIRPDVIDDAFRCVSRGSHDTLDIEFHGGGEPTLAFDQMKQIAIAAKQSIRHPVFRLQTNGVFGEGIRQWLIDNHVIVSISIDGTKELHETQRPGNPNVYDTIVANISALISAKVRVQTLTVVTNYNVGRLVDIYEYFKQLGVTGMMFNPLHRLGRAASVNDAPPWLCPPNSATLVKQLSEVLIRGRREGVSVVSDLMTDLSAYHPRHVRCSACLPAPNVHYNGDLCACTRAYDIALPDENPFVWGKLEDGHAVVNEAKKQVLQKRTLAAMPSCQRCLLRYICAGDCLIENYQQTGDMNQVIAEKCDMKRAIFVNYLLALARK